MMAAQPASLSTDYDNRYEEGFSDSDGGGGGGGMNHQHHPQHQQHQQQQHNDADRYEDHNQPHYMTGSFRGKPCSYYVNGDRHFNAKKLVVNPKHFRDMTHYLDHLTDKLNPNFGAIRKIHTPHHGTRIYNVNELKPGEAYVAAGNEKFKRIGYDQIISHERKKSPPYKYDADPVVHSRIFQCSGKIRKIENSSIIIKVWPNGGEKRTRRPRVVLLRRTSGWNMTTVVVMVNDMLKDDCNGPVESLYTRNGSKLSEVDSLEHNGVYVALTKRDRFKRASYPDFATKDLHTSPRPDRKMLDPLYSGSNNSTSQSSPEHSNASSSQGVSVNGHSRRRPPPKREEDAVFPAKPVKHNRSFDRAKKVDLDKDEGGVFKAKNSNSHTRGAREINDTRHTKTDLPLDQQRATEVDEDLPDDSKDDPYNQYSRQPQQHQRRPPVANGHGGGVEAKPNSRRPPVRSTPPKKDAPKQLRLRNGRDEDEARNLKNEREQSATKIQAGYRGYKARKNLSNRKSQKQKSPSPPPMSPLARQLSSPNAGVTRGRSPSYHDNRTATPKKSPSPPPTSREEEAAKKEAERAASELEDYQSIAKAEANKLVDNASDRYNEEEKAATKIQAGFRGFQSRKEFQAKKAQHEIRSQNREEELAATKIQAGFRGHKARNSLKEMNNNKDDKKRNDATPPAPSPKPAARPPPPALDDDDDDDEDDYDKAATRIQAGFRGYQARKNLRGL